KQTESVSGQVGLTPCLLLFALSGVEVIVVFKGLGWRSALPPGVLLPGGALAASSAGPLGWNE
ncbi:hypothetical protein, partial [Deinococcus xianganensis]